MERVLFLFSWRNFQSPKIAMIHNQISQFWIADGVRESRTRKRIATDDVWFEMKKRPLQAAIGPAWVGEYSSADRETCHGKYCRHHSTACKQPLVLPSEPFQTAMATMARQFHSCIEWL